MLSLIMEPVRKFEVKLLKKITPQIQEQIDALIMYFIKSDPTMQTFGVSTQKKIGEPLLQALRQYAYQSHIIVCIEPTTGQIAGFQSGFEVGKYESPITQVITSPESSENEIELAKFWLYIESLPEGHTQERAGVVAINVTHPDYLKLGISHQIGRCFLILFHKLGVPYLRAECTSEYASKICNFYGQPSTVISIKDYRDSKGRAVFVNPQWPHALLKIYKLDLDHAVKIVDKSKEVRNCVYKVDNEDGISGWFYFGINHFHEIPDENN